MKNIHAFDAMAETMERMANGGVFLSVGGETPNTMTIGWGWIGYCWKKPVFVAVVRPQRHTFEILKREGEFTVSVPTIAPLKRELAFAGTQSGRDMNKFDGHGLTAAPALRVGAPIVAECGLHFECRTLLAQEMDGGRMDDGVRRTAYPGNDFHTMFFGEIVECYRTDD